MKTFVLKESEFIQLQKLSSSCCTSCPLTDNGATMWQLYPLTYGDLRSRAPLRLLKQRLADTTRYVWAHVGSPPASVPASAQLNRCLCDTYWCEHGRSTACSWPAGWSRPLLHQGWTAVPPRRRSSCQFGCWNTFLGWAVWTTGGRLDGSPTSHSHYWTLTGEGGVRRYLWHFEIKSKQFFQKNG